jgi:hypothetical protein
MKTIFEKIGSFFLTILGALLLLVILPIGYVALEYCFDIILSHPFEVALAIIVVILLVCWFRKLYIDHKIDEAIKHGIVSENTGKMYLVEKRMVSLGTYDLDRPLHNDIQQYFFNEYRLYPEADSKEPDQEPSEIVIVDEYRSFIVSKEHLWDMLSRNVNGKKRFYIYTGYKLIQKENI